MITSGPCPLPVTSFTMYSSLKLQKQINAKNAGDKFSPRFSANGQSSSEDSLPLGNTANPFYGQQPNQFFLSEFSANLPEGMTHAGHEALQLFMSEVRRV